MIAQMLSRVNNDINIIKNSSLRAAVLVCKKFVVIKIQYVVEDPDLVRVQVALADLDLGESAPRYVAAVELQLRSQVKLMLM